MPIVSSELADEIVASYESSWVGDGLPVATGRSQCKTPDLYYIKGYQGVKANTCWRGGAHTVIHPSRYDRTWDRKKTNFDDTR
jgi:hypothetical protein